jgi:3-deoxy-D-manno-octulosonic acid kinase
MTAINPYKSYHIGSDPVLTGLQMDQMAACFEKPSERADAILGGRNAVLRIHLTGIGRVVVKTYTRGGIIRHFNKRTYLRVKTIRGRAEYELLQQLKTLGVNAPDPVAFAYRGNRFYHSWLITKEIPDACTLAGLSVNDPGRAQAAMLEVNRQLSLLIKHGIHHVDLHPGNILVDTSDRVYLIDFDKARTNQKNQPLLRKKYIRRWQRAVLKHQLPKTLNLG